MWSAHCQEEGFDELCLHRKPHLLPGAQSALREMSPCRRRSFQGISAVCLCYSFLPQEPRKHPLPLTKELSSDFSSLTTSSYCILLCSGLFWGFFWWCLKACRILVPQPGLNPGHDRESRGLTVDSVELPALLHYLLFPFYLFNMFYFLGNFFSLRSWLISPYICGF